MLLEEVIDVSLKSATAASSFRRDCISTEQLRLLFDYQREERPRAFRDLLRFSFREVFGVVGGHRDERVPRKAGLLLDFSLEVSVSFRLLTDTHANVSNLTF